MVQGELSALTAFQHQFSYTLRAMWALHHQVSREIHGDLPNHVLPVVVPACGKTIKNSRYVYQELDIHPSVVIYDNAQIFERSWASIDRAAMSLEGY